MEFVRTQQFAGEGKYYGKLNPVYFVNNKPKFFLGPQFKFFVVNIIVTVSLEVILNYVTQCSLFQRIGAIILNILLVVNMLRIGVSNPGQASDYFYESNISNGYCTICEIQQYRRVRHCQICDVCIAEYDHHCPFLGRCIGRGNMGDFRSFLCLVMVNLLFMMFLNLFNIGPKNQIS